MTQIFKILLYVFVSDEPDTSRTKSEITPEISATNGGGNGDEAANDEQSVANDDKDTE